MPARSTLSRILLALAVAMPLMVSPVTTAPTALAADDDERRIRLQDEMDAYLTTYPGGSQISDNALTYLDGEVVIVFPVPDSRVAPSGLGSNVRDTELARRVQAQVTSSSSVYGCPGGGWYCFYTDSNFGGRRLQFFSTCADFAADWGFNNSVSAWVNTNPYSQIVALDYSGGPILWVEGYGVSYDNWVGSTANDRMSYWYRTNC